MFFVLFKNGFRFSRCALGVLYVCVCVSERMSLQKCISVRSQFFFLRVDVCALYTYLHSRCGHAIMECGSFEGGGPGEARRTLHISYPFLVYLSPHSFSSSVYLYTPFVRIIAGAGRGATSTNEMGKTGLIGQRQWERDGIRRIAFLAKYIFFFYFVLWWCTVLYVLHIHAGLILQGIRFGGGWWWRTMVSIYAYVCGCVCVCGSMPLGVPNVNFVTS